jgi:hypothetical protein
VRRNGKFVASPTRSNEGKLQLRELQGLHGGADRSRSPAYRVHQPAIPHLRLRGPAGYVWLITLPTRVLPRQEKTRGDRSPVAAPAAPGGAADVSERRGPGQGRDTASEPDPDVCAASVYRLEEGDRFAFLDPFADQRRALGADIAQLGAAFAEDSNGVLVVWVGRLEAQLDHVARCAVHTLHTPVAFALVLVREVNADNGCGQFVHADSLPESLGRA